MLFIHANLSILFCFVLFFNSQGAGVTADGSPFLVMEYCSKGLSVERRKREILANELICFYFPSNIRLPTGYAGIGRTDHLSNAAAIYARYHDVSKIITIVCKINQSAELLLFFWFLFLFAGE